jgi:hypothetical protein
MPARTDLKEQRFDQGAVCVGAYRNDTLMGYVWFCFQQYVEDEARCVYILPAFAAFDFDVYVFPEHRMGRAFAAVWYGATKYLTGIGVGVSFSRVARTNMLSRRSHTRLGARRVGEALFLKLGHLQIMVSTLRPYADVSWTKAPRLMFKRR